MKRVLILTAGYGEGHNAAARALAAGLAGLGAAGEVRDLFLETYGAKQETSRQLYLQCIEHTPLLWAAVYRALDWLPLMRWFVAPSLYTMQARLARVLAERRPDAVVSVYPAYGYLLDRLYRHQRAPFARHTLVTDSLTINSIWYRAGSDTWLVPNEDSAVVLRQRVPVDQLHVTGFPVPLIFADARPMRPAPGRGEPLRVLYMINSARQNAAAIVSRLLAMEDVKLTVTFGKDAALGRELERLAQTARRPLELHGWTPRIPELLMSHHVLIGKAGGAATQEALAACTPLLITKIVPGQEAGNAELIERHQCGAVTITPGAVSAQIEALLAEDCALWHHWHKAIQRVSRPDAARDTARFILADSAQNTPQTSSH